MKTTLSLLLLLSACTIIQAPPTTPPVVTPTPTPSPSPTPIPQAALFPIGVFYQPAYSMAKWKARGINTLIGPEVEGHKDSTWFGRWMKAAQDNDMQVLLSETYPDVDLSIQKGFSQPDEPELQNHQTPEAVFKANYEAAKLKNLPVFCSFSGSDLTNNQNRLTTYYSRWAPYCDIVSTDWYQLNRNASRYFPGDLQGVALKAMAAAWPEKKLWTFVESSDQFLNCPPELINAACKDQPISSTCPARVGRGPSPSELRALIWSDIINGARGIIYFTQAIGSNCPLGRYGGFNFDFTSEEVAAEMTKQNKLIAANADWLLEKAVPVQTAAPFISAQKGSHTIILNRSNSQAKFTDGTTFEAYEVRLK